MNRYRFYIGLGQATEMQQESAHELLAAQFNGYTIINSTGYWRNENGQDFSEDSSIYEVLTDKQIETALQIAETLKEIFEQESVLFTADSAIEGRFV